MAFPDTRQSALLRLHDEDKLVRRQSYQTIIEAYWSPVNGYLRKRWRETDEDAADLTQSFFSKAIEAGTLLRYDPSKAAFRTYLRICLDNFVINARKQASKRQTIPLDFDVHAPAESPEEMFRQEWIRSLFGLAIADLKNARDDMRFRVFELYDLNESETRPTYADLARQFDTTPERITNYLAAMRRDFRKAVLNRLRDIATTEREFRSEARAILGMEV